MEVWRWRRAAAAGHRYLTRIKEEPLPAAAVHRDTHHATTRAPPGRRGRAARARRLHTCSRNRKEID